MVQIMEEVEEVVEEWETETVVVHRKNGT